MALTAEQYLARADPRALLARLRVPDPEALARNLEHFTEDQARQRDRAVVEMLGSDGAQRVVDAVVEGLLPAGAMNPQPAILDLGAGSGFFTQRVDQGLRARGLRPRIFALDASPAMLRVLAAKPGLRAVPFLGVLEDVAGSVREASALQPLPEVFDAAFSTLALHHCADLPGFFEGAARVLVPGAPVVVVDLVEHGHEALRGQGDVHLGFRPATIEALALDRFHRAEARVLGDTCCRSGGAEVQLFAAVLQR